jgi:hypothetical protein
VIVFTSAGDISFIENEFAEVELDKFNPVLDTNFIRRPIVDTRSFETIHNADVRYLS